jgi:hypothetical protein
MQPMLFTLSPLHPEKTNNTHDGERLPHAAWKGHSGNPGGRPKITAEIQTLARGHGQEAIERLVVLMHLKNDSVAVP